MCGIVGYTGRQSASKILLKNLKRLEYRGYDSSGIALVNDSFFVGKKCGKIAALEDYIKDKDLSEFTTGIAHTRWATHGEPSDVNAHPHLSESGDIAIIHNGIIENFRSLRQILESNGVTIRTQTDSEVIAHLVEYYYKKSGDLLDSVLQALSKLEGTYGIAVVSRHSPGRIIAARKGSPLIMGVGDNENMIASDASAIIEQTRKVVYLEDGEVIDLYPDHYEIYNAQRALLDKAVETIEWDLASIEKAGYDHFMLKEIFEQTETITNTFRGRVLLESGNVRLDGLNLTKEDIASVKRILFISCGTSWHASLIGKYLIEEFGRIPVEVEYASEFRYKKPILYPSDLVFVVSQSGETADTLAAMREAKQRGIRVMGITNVVGSTIARESDGGVYIHAGHEIGVASTKAFTSQVTVMIMLAVLFGRRGDMSFEEGLRALEELVAVPGRIATIFSQVDKIKRIANEFGEAQNFIYLGRDVHFPVALEGALKLKEISYIHAEGYPAAEMKHGPIALIDNNMPVVFIALKDAIYPKIVSNIQEVRARGGKIIVIATEGDTEIQNLADYVIWVPESDKIVAPLLTVIPMQLLAYYIALLRGCDVDQPRNLAKSVTVE